MKKPSPETVEVSFPGTQTGKLKDLGGSVSDDFNNVLANQVVNALWQAPDPETRNKQIQAAIIVKAREKMRRRVGVKMHLGASSQGHIEHHVSI